MEIEDINDEEDDETSFDVCPECGSQITIKWSGIKCSNPECDYWFCY